MDMALISNFGDELERFNHLITFIKKVEYNTRLNTAIFAAAFSPTKYEKDWTNFQEELKKISKQIEISKEELEKEFSVNHVQQLEDSIRKLLEFCYEFTKSQLPIEALEEQISESNTPNNDLTLKSDIKKQSIFEKKNLMEQPENKSNLPKQKMKMKF